MTEDQINRAIKWSYRLLQQGRQKWSDELVNHLFDRTPITPEILEEEGAIEDREAECWRLNGALISNDDNHWHVMSDSIDSVHVKTLGELRRAMTIGKDW